MNEILQKRIEEAAKKQSNKYGCSLYVLGHFKDGATFALQNQWISVDEALPEEFDDGSEFVFVIVKDDETSYYDTDYISNGKWALHNSDKVTHWMSIPKLKGENLNKQ